MSSAAKNFSSLVDRPLAYGEPRLVRNGRWLLSKGVTVEEKDGVWRFTVTGFPDEPMRPAMAELVLPDDFRLETQHMFSIEGRLAPRDVDELFRVPEPRAEPRFSSADREPVGFFWRTRNGNLYMTFTLEDVRKEWRTFFQMAGNIGMGFYGRAELPWRFLENKPAALVFHFRPRFLPAVYEFRNAAISDYAAGR